MRLILSLLNLMALLKVAQSAIAVRKFVHQKDMSEHCRRRVVPSVFLGKHVVDANSQILHFSRLQLPYSCSISVRTEFGNNIILVIQLLSDHSLTRSCGPDHSQLLIYELGETFGGYWGGLPDVMMNMESQNHTKFYTLKTTPTTVETSPPKLEEEEEEEVKKDASSHIPLSSPDLKETEEDFIRIEVPLLNVSGDLGVNEISQNKMDVDEFLDLVYDVTPRSDGNYDTSILPLVRFSVRKQTEREDYGPPFKSKYELDYDLGYTPDSRITFRTKYRKTTRRYEVYKTNFRRRNNKDFHAKPTFWRNRLVKTTLKPRPYFNIKEPTTKLIPTINENILSNIYNNTLQNNKSSWDVIVDLFKSLNTSLKPYIEEITKDVTVAKQNTQRTKNIPLDGSKSSSIQHQVEAVTIKSAFLKNISTTMLGHDSKDTDNNITSFGKDQALQGVTEDEVKVFFTRNDDVDRETGSLVNHKSFENIVQTAPIISVLLNRTNASEPYNSSSPRKKRYIKALEIENARPRVLTTRKSMRRTTEKVYRYSDMQDLAQLVELQDDEMQGRVALRYLRKYVGSPLFNICDYQEPKARQVYLFNSSRIVIAVSNFTMERMTLVVTPARTLLNSVGRCPPAHLECQVAGTRVCIDSTNQCDGVPNCGAYDIYDEDRLRCGWSLGLQHNVCLAACTFLAVISTILYTVHYWLKRCVPRVSEAFFIYADASENILFLDSIMRSPNDNTDNYSRLFYQPNIFEDDEAFLKDSNNNSLWSKIITYLKLYLLCKRKKVDKRHSNEDFDKEYEQVSAIPRKLYSFTELELRNITPIIKDVMVQTGSSLEDYQIDTKDEEQEETKATDNSKIVDAKSSSELNLLKIIRNLKIQSPEESNASDNKDANKTDNPDVEETEIHSTIYEKSANRETEPPSILTVHKKGQQTRKQLRFDEEIAIIPTIEGEEESEQSESAAGSSRHLNAGKQVGKRSSNSGNEFMRFWRSSKSKKSKSSKKSHLSLR